MRKDQITNWEKQEEMIGGQMHDLGKDLEEEKSGTSKKDKSTIVQAN